MPRREGVYGLKKRRYQNRFDQTRINWYKFLNGKRVFAAADFECEPGTPHTIDKAVFKPAMRSSPLRRC